MVNFKVITSRDLQHIHSLGKITHRYIFSEYSLGLLGSGLVDRCTCKVYNFECKLTCVFAFKPDEKVILRRVGIQIGFERLRNNPVKNQFSLGIGNGLKYTAIVSHNNHTILSFVIYGNCLLISVVPDHNTIPVPLITCSFSRRY